MIRAVLFDRAGVLIRRTGHTGRDEWARTHGVDSDALQRVIVDAIGPGWAGGRSEDDIDARLRTALGLDAAGVAELQDALRSDEALDAEMAAYVTGLPPRVRTAIVTNSGPRERALLERRYRMHELVDLIVVSAEEGVAKPDAEIFLRTAKRLGVEPNECLVVDDNPTYLVGAAATGMECVLFRDSTSCIADLDLVLQRR